MRRDGLPHCIRKNRSMLRQHQPEHRGQIDNLLRRQIARVQSAQQQIEFCGFFQFLDREYRGFQRVAGHYRAVIGQQHGGVFPGQPLDGEPPMSELPTFLEPPSVTR